MKRRFLLIALCAGIAGLTFSSYGSGPFQGGAGNRTGSAGSPANCSTGGGCHAANNTSTQVATRLLTTTGQPVARYSPGVTYEVVLAGSNTGGSLTKFGFQASCVKAAATGTQAGTFTSTTTNISVLSSGSLQFAEHNTPIAAASTAGANSVYQASFNWTAPLSGTGTVRFYATLNAVNNNASTSGDQPNTGTPLDVPEATPGTVGGNSVTAAYLSVYPNPATDALHLKLDGTGNTCVVRITDINGRVVAAEQPAVFNGEAIADIARLKPGNYYIMAIRDGGQHLAPFVKY